MGYISFILFKPLVNNECNDRIRMGFIPSLDNLAHLVDLPFVEFIVQRYMDGCNIFRRQLAVVLGFRVSPPQFVTLVRPNVSKTSPPAPNSLKSAKLKLVKGGLEAGVGGQTSAICKMS